MDRLLDLHWRGWITRAEIERELGLDPPRGQWQCNGQFGPDGRWARCCGEAA
jgi:hypothetical protein